MSTQNLNPTVWGGEGEDFGRLAEVPGVPQLLNARSQREWSELAAQYPDAAFALKVAADRREPSYELACISHKAFRAILAGEEIQSVRVKYDKDVERFVKKLMWD